MHRALHRSVHLAKQKYKTIPFLYNFLQAPLQVGAVCPSGNSLVSALIKHAAIETDGLIIDLGAGSGAVSSKLIHAGVNAERILAIEISSDFAEDFKKSCPSVSLVIGDARQLHTIVSTHMPNKPISLIISSLPFRSLPEKCTQQIMNTLQYIMGQHKCQLVQYSYAWWLQYPLEKYGFLPQSSEFVMKNLPPARVEWYNFRSNTAHPNL